MHFSLSPCMALAVRAIMGEFFVLIQLADFTHCFIAIHFGHHDVHKYQVDSLVVFEFFDAFSTISSNRYLQSFSSSKLLRAKTFRISSSTINTFFSRMMSSLLWITLSIFCLSSGRFDSTRCRNRVVSARSRSGERTPLIIILSEYRRNCSSSFLDSSFPV